MNKKIKYGKWFVLVSAFACCSLSAIVIFMYLNRMGYSMENIIPRTIRFLLTAGIFTLIYRGHNWARWLMIIFLSLAVLLMIRNLHSVLVVIMFLVYLMTIILLLTPNVTAYLKHIKGNSVDEETSAI